MTNDGVVIVILILQFMYICLYILVGGSRGLFVHKQSNFKQSFIRFNVCHTQICDKFH